jgi:hypothetical protein
MWVGNLIHPSAHQAGPDLEEIDPWATKKIAFNSSCSMCSHCLSVRPPIRAGLDRTGFTHVCHFMCVCVCPPIRLRSCRQLTTAQLLFLFCALLFSHAFVCECRSCRQVNTAQLLFLFCWVQIVDIPPLIFDSVCLSVRPSLDRTGPDFQVVRLSVCLSFTCALLFSQAF